MLSDYSSDEAVLTNKQLFAFSQGSTGEAMFASWAEDKSPAQVQAAIIELNAFAENQKAQIEQEVVRASNEHVSGRLLKKKVDEIQLFFCKSHPWYVQNEHNATALWARMIHNAGFSNAEEFGNQVEAEWKGYGYSDAGLDKIGNDLLVGLETAAKELWQESRIQIDADMVEAGHTPWSRFYASDTEPVTEFPSVEDVEKALEAGEISLSDVEALANEQLRQEAEARGEGVTRQADDIILSNHRPAPESGSPKGERGFASLMFGTNVDRRRG